MTGIAKPTPEARLRAERDRFVALAFCWADTLIELDSELSIVYAAGLTMAVTGYGPGDLVGRPVDDVLMPESRPAIRYLLGVARTCGRIDNGSILFRGPDGGPDDGPDGALNGDGVPVDLAAHTLPDLGDQSFLAIRLRGAIAPSRRSQTLIDRGPESEAFIVAARRLLSGCQGRAVASKSTSKTAAILTLISMPGLSTTPQAPRVNAHRMLMSTLVGYLKARSLDRSSAATLADGRYALVHDAGLDVEQLESQLLSFVKELFPTDMDASIESASIAPNASLSDEALGQVVVHAIRHFRDADDIGHSLDELRRALPKVAADATETARAFAGLIESGGFHMVFQPVTFGDGGKPLFHEGIARIDGPDDTLPRRYLTYAEETGQIGAFDLTVIGKALAWMEDRPEPKPRISIDLSSLSINDPEFITGLNRLLDSHPVSGPHLAFEITGSSRIGDPETAKRFIQSLRERGHMIGLDDFGANIRGFHLLAELEVDFVKFGAGARSAAEGAGRPRALLVSLAAFCRLQGIRTIATAVDTSDSLTRFRDCGIECFQGDLIGKPRRDIQSTTA